MIGYIYICIYVASRASNCLQSSCTHTCIRTDKLVDVLYPNRLTHTHVRTHALTHTYIATYLKSVFKSALLCTQYLATMLNIVCYVFIHIYRVCKCNACWHLELSVSREKEAFGSFFSYVSYALSFIVFHSSQKRKRTNVNKVVINQS